MVVVFFQWILKQTCFRIIGELICFDFFLDEAILYNTNYKIFYQLYKKMLLPSWLLFLELIKYQRCCAYSLKYALKQLLISTIQLCMPSWSCTCAVAILSIWWLSTALLKFNYLFTLSWLRHLFVSPFSLSRSCKSLVIMADSDSFPYLHSSCLSAIDLSENSYLNVYVFHFANSDYKQLAKHVLFGSLGNIYRTINTGKQWDS